MTLETLLLFAVTEFLLCLSPGPAVLAVVMLTLRGGARPGLAASAGVVAATAVYFALSALGLGAIIVASATLFTLVKWLGAAYLVVLGIGAVLPLARRLWRGGGADAAADTPVVRQRIRAGDGFRRGFAVQLSSPKTMMFFIALFPQFISPEAAVAPQFVAMGLVSASIEMPVLAAYVLATTASARFMRERVALWLDAAGGAVLVALGAALATQRR